VSEKQAERALVLWWWTNWALIMLVIQGMFQVWK
jgi:hypothetical protein